MSMSLHMTCKHNSKEKFWNLVLKYSKWSCVTTVNIILRQIIGSATRTVNETGLINIWTSGKQGVILYYLKLNILSVEEWYT